MCSVYTIQYTTKPQSCKKQKISNENSTVKHAQMAIRSKCARMIEWVSSHLFVYVKLMRIVCAQFNRRMFLFRYILAPYTHIYVYFCLSTFLTVTLSLSLFVSFSVSMLVMNSVLCVETELWCHADFSLIQIKYIPKKKKREKKPLWLHGIDRIDYIVCVDIAN